MGPGYRSGSDKAVEKDYFIDKSDMAAEADRTEASTKQAVGKLTGDRVTGEQNIKEDSKKEPEKADATTLEVDKANIR